MMWKPREMVFDASDAGSGGHGARSLSPGSEVVIVAVLPSMKISGGEGRQVAG